MLRSAFAVALLATVGAAAAPVGASEAPAFKADRTAEDYAYLRTSPAAGPGYKFVALDGAGTRYLSLRGEAKTVVEAYDAPRFGIATAPDTYLLQRLLLHADLHLGTGARVFAQIGAHEAEGKKLPGPADEDHLDLQQLFLDLRTGDQLTLRLGRQELAFNPAQRFVNYRETSNVRLSFDGARATLQAGRTKIDAFVVRPVLTERGVFDDKPNDDAAFAGVYASRKLTPELAVDGYWFWLGRERVRFGAVTGDENRHSFGLRVAGVSGQLDWDVEAMLQRGSFADQDIVAWGGGGEVGYTFRTWMKPRLSVRLDAGSGDERSTDRDLNSFNPLFPRAGYFSEAGLTSFSNLVSVRTDLRLQPAPGLAIEAAVAHNRRESRHDAVYVAPSTAIAATIGNQAKGIGRQVLLGLKWQVNRHVQLQAAYVRHSAGEAIQAAGGRAVHFARSGIQIKF